MEEGRHAMNSLQEISAIISRWLDSVAAAIVAAVNKLTFPRTVRLAEDAGGSLMVQSGASDSSEGERLRIADGKVADAVSGNFAAALRGSRVEILLQPKRFLFRPLE